MVLHSRFLPFDDHTDMIFSSQFPHRRFHPKKHGAKYERRCRAARHLADLSSHMEDHHIKELNDSVMVSLDLPGVKAADLVVQVDDNVLSISASRKLPNGALRKWTRKFHLDDSIQKDAVQANLSDGLLVIKAPKKEEIPSVKIQVTEQPHEEIMSDDAAASEAEAIVIDTTATDDGEPIQSDDDDKKSAPN